VLAKDDHFPEAVANVACGFRVAEHAASDPVLIAWLVAIVSEQFALSGMEQILYLAGPDAAVAERVRETIDARRPRLDLARTLRGEVGFVTVEIETTRRGGPQELHDMLAFFDLDWNTDPPRQRPVRGRAFTAGEKRFISNLLDAMEADVLRRARRAIAGAGRPYADRAALYRELANVPRPEHNPVTAVSENLIPLFGSADEGGMRVRALEEAIMAGAALLAFKARRGAFPASMRAALPQSPLDPFTGQPLQYRREGEGFVVYSVGADGKFDGGRPGTPRTPGQVLFRYPRPAAGIRGPQIDRSTP
jgi:hypothetical protein